MRIHLGPWEKNWHDLKLQFGRRSSMPDVPPDLFVTSSPDNSNKGDESAY